jgi:hypothetical protein
MKSLITKDFGVTNAINFENMISDAEANVYIMVGRSIPWANLSDPTVLDDDFISAPYDTTAYKYQAMRDGIILKKITANDVQPVVPRVDWVSGTVYVAYDQSANLYIKSTDTRVVNTTSTTGNVNVGAGSANTVNANGINFTTTTPALSIGSVIRIGEYGTEFREVVSKNSTALLVNTAFSSSYATQNLFLVETSSLQYSNKFYVRNSQDQVFKCLYNNDDAQSTIMPQIALDGQLPENPYIQTSDGYKWKYLYTIPTGLKNKFFTDKYMPVVRDTTVFTNAEDGRIDIVKIINGGTTYADGDTVSNYGSANVIGDGTGASMTFDVVAGVITDVNIIDGGNNYTTATMTVVDNLFDTATGTPAEFEVVISPQFGHGYSPVRELGAASQMISVDFEGDVSGFFKVQNDGTDDFRQICIVKDPKYANGQFATAEILPMYTLVYTVDLGGRPEFVHDELAFVGSSYASALCSGRIVHFDDALNAIVLNNITGNVDSIVTNVVNQKDAPSISAKAISIDKPDINIFSGQILYIENRAKITRSTNQTETIKTVIEF